MNGGNAHAAPLPATVLVETPLAESDHGAYLVARISCASANPQPAWLVLDPVRNRLVLTAACGCHVYVPITPWLADLAKLVAEQHHTGACPTPPAPATAADQPTQQAEAPAHLH